MIINPYELLGVSINSSLDEIKQRFYALALFIHPDKGGSNEDMIILNHAYKFIVNEISSIKNISVEALEKEFKNFCDIQEKTIPEFRDLYADLFDLPKFNEYYNTRVIDTECIKASFGGGYGNLMDTSEMSIIYDENKLTNNNNKFQLIEYKPLFETQQFPHVYDYTIEEPIKDFTINCNKLILSDYYQSYIDAEKKDIYVEQEINLDDFIKKRDLDIIVNSPLNTC